MMFFSGLQELLSHDSQSKALFDSLPATAQVNLQEQRQGIHSFEELRSYADGLKKQNQSW